MRRAGVLLVVVLMVFGGCARRAPAHSGPLVRPAPTSSPAPTPSQTTVPVPPAETVTNASIEGCTPKLTEFPTGITNSEAGAITSGPDGALWFVDGKSSVGRMTTSGKVWTLKLRSGAAALGITTGPDRAIWFTDAGRSLVGRLSMDGKLSEYPLPPDADHKNWEPDGTARPTTIIPGPDGAVWFVETGADKIGRITSSGAITEFDLPDDDLFHHNPEDLSFGPDGTLWFSQTLAPTLGSFHPADHTFTQLRIVDESGEDVTSPTSIEAAPEGIWFSQMSGHRIGRTTPDGKVTYVKLPTPGANPQGITIGRDGNVWVAEGGGNRIARITKAGVVTELDELGSSQVLFGTRPAGIATGPDGAVWFSESRIGKIGRYACP